MAKRLNRFELRDRWIERQLRESRYIGNLLIANPDVRNAIEYAFLMGYNARERQDSRRKVAARQEGT